MNYFSSDFKLGILGGGGQLGKMLLFDVVCLESPLPVINSSKEI
jgi:hypothetical protein